MEVRKNDVVNGKIVDINDDGQGVLKTDNGIVVFIPNSLPDEEVNVQIINTKSKFYIGKVCEIINKSIHRVQPACPYFGRCGGCDIMHMDKNYALDYKTQKVKSLLKKIAGVDIYVNPTISKNTFSYRNKIALPISPKGEIGLYRKNTHNVLPITECIITEPWHKIIIEIMNEYIQTSKIPCYDEKTKTGILKHIVARHINNQLLLTLVVTDKKIPNQQLLIKLLKNKFFNFGLNININTLNNNVILSDKWHHIYGLNNITNNDFGIIHPISNASFYQVNNEIKNEIYQKVLDNISSESVVIDAYSGAGLLSGIISTKAKKCYGVEIIKQATDNANNLKNENKLFNLTNINGDCAIVIPELIKKIDNKNSIVTLDPPRKGCDKKVLDAIIKATPEKILYISCDPSTLARDTKIILESGIFDLIEVQPYDMFPQTKHVETFCKFVKK